jgi:hypothetical protein
MSIMSTRTFEWHRMEMSIVILKTTGRSNNLSKVASKVSEVASQWGESTCEWGGIGSEATVVAFGPDYKRGSADWRKPLVYTWREMIKKMSTC